MLSKHLFHLKVSEVAVSSSCNTYSSDMCTITLTFFRILLKLQSLLLLFISIFLSPSEISHTHTHTQIQMCLSISIELPCWLSGKESTCDAGDASSILGWEDPLEKEIGTHSSILAWSIPWTEEPDGLQSMGSKRVGHN